MHRALDWLFNGPVWRSFVAMGVFGGLFTLTSLNLLRLFMANYSLLAEFGLMGLKDGGALQLLQLALSGYLSLAFYVLFKGCLYGILGRFQKH